MFAKTSAAVLLTAATLTGCVEVKSLTHMGGPGNMQIVMSASTMKPAKALKRAIDKEASTYCGHENFWAQYRVWGRSEKVSGPVYVSSVPTREMYASIRCDGPPPAQDS